MASPFRRRRPPALPLRGSYQDPTQLYHNAARYYDTRTGRFTQPDPSGLEANPYLYASGDPTNVIDPSGLWGGLGKIFDAGSWAGTVGSFFTGDMKGLRANFASLIVGAGITGICEGGATVVTGGTGTVPATPFCVAIGLLQELPPTKPPSRQLRSLGLGASQVGAPRVIFG
ncbi:RHS repeat-associated core domain-containing protein [Streptomyces albiaxialis]|uniref:RHS repeat-associated core domain-containing protein n=1 Tax=Streptomyces albiaxialis TaxID=329523 RepID=UPI0031DDE851